MNSTIHDQIISIEDKIEAERSDGEGLPDMEEIN